MISRKQIVKKIFPDIESYDSKVFRKSNLFKLYYKEKLNKQDKYNLKEAYNFYRVKGKKK